MDKPTICLSLAALGIIAYSVVGYALTNAGRSAIGHIQVEKAKDARTPVWVQKPAKAERRG